jgi:hypothetical protein
VPLEEEQQPPPDGTPIVLDLDRGGFRFTDLGGGVAFDLDSDGVAERISWTDPSFGDALLVLDRNDNGKIDDGTELFGSYTPQPPTEAPNGFLALAVFDGNGDGWITAADQVFDALLTWKDANQDGLSQPAELGSLSAAGISGLELRHIASYRRDRHGNLLRWVGPVAFGDLKRLAAGDVIFLAEE